MQDAPLLDDLEVKLRSCSTRRERAMLRARQGIYLARTRRLRDAQSIPDEIRQLCAGNEDPEVYAWVWLLEGILRFYESGTTRGLKSLRRAVAMSKAINNIPLIQYIESWMAQFHYTDDQFVEMALALKESNLLDAHFPEAACRACLVHAGALQTVGAQEEATRAFGRSRDIARQIGDRASIMASIENRAILRLDELWIRWAHDEYDASQVGQVETELRGGLAYEAATGSEALIEQAPILRIRLEVLKGNYSEAFRALDALQEVESSYNFSMVRASSILHLWLKFVVTKVKPIPEQILAIDPQTIQGLDNDDALVCWKLLKDLAIEINDNNLIDTFEDKIVGAREKQESRIRGLRKALLDMALL